MTIRPYLDQDADDVVELSLRAWAPVFDSIKQVMDPAVYKLLYPEGWHKSQKAAVETVLAEQHVWVAERDGAPVGFVSVLLHRDDRIGEIHMIAVDPEHQQKGLGRALTDHAVEWMRDVGMELAMVETGGDPGHAAARQLYAKTGFQKLPIARYFKRL
ncbi:MAG: GNAT family N-acetyltransferase [Bacteroidetes bacterium]|jgi:GNAT superfamily N-acetyltransferase|nr:GNAT family N-acetyltransferase [Bacteroidota bacterium]